MQDYRPMVKVALAAAIVLAMQLAGFLGIFFVAILGATVTDGLATGAIRYAPTINRAETPGKYWLIIGLLSIVVAINIIGLFLRH